MNKKSVTIVFPEKLIGERIFPKDLAEFVTKFYKDKGVNVKPGESALGIEKKGDKLVLELAQTGDFLLEVPDTVFKVGFAAETEDLLNNAHKKLVEKRLAFICANDVSATDAGFAVDTNRITILYKDGRQEELPLMSKREVAGIILDRVEEMLIDG